MSIPTWLTPASQPGKTIGLTKSIKICSFEQIMSLDKQLTTIDLFAGAGGITEGFRQAGYQCLFANDFDKHACETFSLNHSGVDVSPGPIEDLDPSGIRKGLALQRGELDVLVGGPPCQGFSINAPGRFVEDPRNALFKHYLHFVDEFAPKTFLFENVPGMLSLGGGRIFENIIAEMNERGYHTRAQIILAAHYGVPQVRWRMIILGSRIGEAPKHPEASHFYTCRANFKGGATMATRLLPLDEFRLLPATTLRDAIYDLPPLKAGEGGETSCYDGHSNDSPYAEKMRGSGQVLYNHTANRLSEINLERLKHILPGEAWTSIPFDLLPKGMQRARRTDHTMRYGRLAWDSLSGTMMTKCDPHWGAVFHPDQARTFTVREAARIQSFGDHYRFLGPRVAQYKQVGNAVPVMMAEAIARAIRQCLATKTHEFSCR